MIASPYVISTDDTARIQKSIDDIHTAIKECFNETEYSRYLKFYEIFAKIINNLQNSGNRQSSIVNLLLFCNIIIDKNGHESNNSQLSAKLSFIHENIMNILRQNFAINEYQSLIASLSGMYGSLFLDSKTFTEYNTAIQKTISDYTRTIIKNQGIRQLCIDEISKLIKGTFMSDRTNTVTKSPVELYKILKTKNFLLSKPFASIIDVFVQLLPRQYTKESILNDISLTLNARLAGTVIDSESLLKYLQKKYDIQIIFFNATKNDIIIDDVIQYNKQMTIHNEMMYFPSFKNRPVNSHLFKNTSLKEASLYKLRQHIINNSADNIPGKFAGLDVSTFVDPLRYYSSNSGTRGNGISVNDFTTQTIYGNSDPFVIVFSNGNNVDVPEHVFQSRFACVWVESATNMKIISNIQGKCLFGNVTDIPNYTDVYPFLPAEDQVAKFAKNKTELLQLDKLAVFYQNYDFIMDTKLINTSLLKQIIDIHTLTGNERMPDKHSLKDNPIILRKMISLIIDINNFTGAQNTKKYTFDWSSKYIKNREFNIQVIIPQLLKIKNDNKMVSEGTTCEKLPFIFAFDKTNKSFKIKKNYNVTQFIAIVAFYINSIILYGIPINEEFIEIASDVIVTST